MTDKNETVRKCRACGGRGYFHCDCWPCDCICGNDYDPCDTCEGEGWIDDIFEIGEPIGEEE